MALAVVACTKLHTSTGNNCSGAITTPSAGNLLAAGGTAWYTGAGVWSASDTPNGAWTKITENTGTNADTGLFYKDNVAGAATTVTVTDTGAASGATAYIYEVSGYNTSSPRTGGEESNTSSTTTTPATTAVTNGTADAILFALLAIDDAANPATVTINQAGSNGTWSEHANARETNGTNFMVGSMVYQIVTSSAARGHTWGTSNSASSRLEASFNSVPTAPAVIPAGTPTWDFTHPPMRVA